MNSTNLHFTYLHNVLGNDSHVGIEYDIKTGHICVMITCSHQSAININTSYPQFVMKSLIISCYSVFPHK